MYFNIVDFHTNQTLTWIGAKDWDQASKVAKFKKHYLKKEFGCELFYIIEMSKQEREQAFAASRNLINNVYGVAGTAD